LASSPQLKPIKYDLKEEDLPEPIPDGTRELIKALFLEGEGIRIASARLNEDDREIPDGGGISLSREEWLKKLDKVKGDPNGIFKSSDKTGIYVAINPYKPACTKDADVTDFRHALVEFDEGLSPEEQLNLYQQMNLPCAAVIYSGGKSVHAWVKVEARDRAEYDERVRIVYEHFLAAGFQLDVKNKNPGRFSRLPNCIRFDCRQELLYLNIGAESFTQWIEEVRGDDLGERHTIDDLEKVDPADKTNVLLGDDWLNRGASCLISGPSGIGKSSLAIQCAILWGLGRPAFGISPTRALKSVIIGAENDERDNQRMVFGILKRLGVDKEFTPGEYQLVRENLILRYNYTASADRFVNVARRIADKEKPDLMWLDPTAAFVGDDLSKQTVIASFFRNGLHPIAKARGFAWMVINHFTKPPGDAGARKGWTTSDHQYRGAGSYDLAGWARAVVTIAESGEGLFQLRFAKRHSQSGACHPSGEPSPVLWLRHAQEGVFWEQLDAPAEPQPGEEKPKELTIVQVVENLARNGDMRLLLDSIPSDGLSLNKTAQALKAWFLAPSSPVAKERRKKGMGDTKAKECVTALQVEGYLTLSNGLYVASKP
jgi:RecA-family ATPase